MTMQPLTEAPRALLAVVAAVLTDIDDTLTLHGRLPAEAYTALWRLRRAGVKVELWDNLSGLFNRKKTVN